jgi:transcriptional regulator with XRE-family HTH domain
MEQLKRLREARGLSQTKLAARADVNPATVNQIEGGKRTASPATLHKLAAALDVSLYELLEGEPHPKASASSQPSFNGLLEEERHEGTEYAHWSTSLDRIGAAGNAALEVVQEWRDESTRMLDEGRPPAKNRVLEMRSFHNEMSVIFKTNLDDILEGARRGTISTGYSSDEPQDLAEDPSLWPRALREYVYDAGSRIAVLPAVIESLEREWAARGFESKSIDTQRGGTVEGGLPSGVAREAGWQEAVERAREEAGIR